MPILKGDLLDTHWDTLRSLLPLYMSITTSVVRD